MSAKKASFYISKQVKGDFLKPLILKTASIKV